LDQSRAYHGESVDVRDPEVLARFIPKKGKPGKRWFAGLFLETLCGLLVAVHFDVTLGRFARVMHRM
jgi:hypothetical protein